MTTAEDRLQRQAWGRFDRLTAHGCAERHQPYVVSAMQEAWTDYQLLFHAEPTHHYGDSRDLIPRT